MLHQEKELPNDSGGRLSNMIILQIKSKMAAAKKQCFFAFSVLN